MKDELIKMGFEYDRSSVPDPINFPFCTRYLKDPYIVQESEEGWLVRKENPQRHYPIIFEKLNYTELLLELNKLLQPPIKEFLESYGFKYSGDQPIYRAGTPAELGDFTKGHIRLKSSRPYWYIHKDIRIGESILFRQELTEVELRNWVKRNIFKPEVQKIEIDLEQLKISKLNLNL